MLLSCLYWLLKNLHILHLVPMLCLFLLAVTKIAQRIVDWMHISHSWCFVLYLLTKVVTNFMKQSPSSEANSHTANQEILCIFWNPEFHYCAHKGPHKINKDSFVISHWSTAVTACDNHALSLDILFVTCFRTNSNDAIHVSVTFSSHVLPLCLIPSTFAASLMYKLILYMLY
jgi:hypothetical protein